MLETLRAALGTAAGQTAGSVAVLLLVLLIPVAAATVVFTWHGLRGTHPGPAAELLLKLVELLLPGRRRR